MDPIRLPGGLSASAMISLLFIPPQLLLFLRTGLS
jgi:hypothetical protein